MIKGVIFDMDGTALDSMGNWEINRNEYLKSLGVQLDDYETLSIKDLDWEETVDYVNDLKGTNFDFKAYRDGILETHYGKYKKEYKLMPGFLSFLDYLDSRDIKYCIATATRYYGAESVFERFGLIDRIEFIITEGSVGYTKDYPNIYIEATNRMGLDVSEVIVFEDALYAVETAKKAGFKTVAIREPFYIRDHSRIEEVSDLIIEDFNELLDMIEEDEVDFI